MVDRTKMTLKKAVDKINEFGALLVYPIPNQPEPKSLWSTFFPRTKMKWEWDTGGADDRVARLWHLRTEVSASGKAVYAKWYGGRATFFSKDVFVALLSFLGSPRASLSPAAQEVLEALEDDSPLSTKELKKRLGKTGKAFQTEYEKVLKELWRALLIVGYGEVEDGAFPSLAIGATSRLFDDLWEFSLGLDPNEAEQRLRKAWGAESKLMAFAVKSRTSQRPKVDPKKGTLRYEDLA
jgi:hypothetical protein